MEANNSSTNLGLACCIFVFWVIHLSIGITAVVQSSSDEIAMNKTYGPTFYYQLPVASIVFPNPFLTAVTAFVPDCKDFDNCDETYRDLYIVLFVIDLIIHLTNWCVSNCGHSKTEKLAYPFPEFCSLKGIKKLASVGGGDGATQQHSQVTSHCNSQVNFGVHPNNHHNQFHNNHATNQINQFNGYMNDAYNHNQQIPSHNTQYSGFSTHINTNRAVKPI